MVATGNFTDDFKCDVVAQITERGYGTLGAACSIVGARLCAVQFVRHCSSKRAVGAPARSQA